MNPAMHSPPQSAVAAASSAREREAGLVARCVAVCRGDVTAACDRREASVFRVAASVLGRHRQAEARRLLDVSSRYFVAHPGECVPAAEVVRNGWVQGLPRFRALLDAGLSA